MLLRLLPRPTPSQPTPPTILFTLPLPTHPYTSRSLPLPANLLAHKTVCLHEDIDCSNVLLGEKSTWISGVVDEVTFSLPLQNVRIHFIDGSATTLDLEPECAQSLARVVDQVNLSFAPKPKQTPSRSASRPTSISSGSSSSRASSPTSRRSTSALLLTLLSPLLPSTSSQAVKRYEPADPQYASRIHRRQARSLLVDTYRRYVLPELKLRLPGAYLSWAVRSEVSQRTAEYENIKLEINSVLAASGYDETTRERFMQTRRARSFTSSTMSSISSVGSASDDELSQDTPPSSIHTSRCSSPQERIMTASPHTFLLSIPPAHELPIGSRSVYSQHLADLTRIASRLSAIKRLDIQYEREESKRRWLENLERGKAGERALRRAWSNGQSQVTHTSYYQPIRSSRLWRSWTAEDEEASTTSIAIHPAMMEDESEIEVEVEVEVDVEVSSISSSSSISIDEPNLITPPASTSSKQGLSIITNFDTPTRPSLARKPVPSLRDLEHSWQYEEEEFAKPLSLASITIEQESEKPPLPPRPDVWSALTVAHPPQARVGVVPATRGLKTRFTDWVRADRDDQEIAVLPVLY